MKQQLNGQANVEKEKKKLNKAVLYQFRSIAITKTYNYFTLLAMNIRC